MKYVVLATGQCWKNIFFRIGVIAVGTYILFLGLVANAIAYDFPGTVVDYVPPPDSDNTYIGCPSIAILPNGDYVASHSFFGPATTSDQSVVFKSQDRGQTWQPLADLDGQWWSNLFVHNQDLYIMGVDERFGSVAIRRSTDGGQTWTTPNDSASGLLRDDGERYHCAPVPMLIHNGRIWRSFETTHDSSSTYPFSSFVMSAPVDADLLDASNWSATNILPFDLSRLTKPDPEGWREGNILAAPNGDLVNFLRIGDYGADRADTLRVSADGSQIYFDDVNWGKIDSFPGGAVKFTIRYDPVSELYWTLSDKQKDPSAVRNHLVLACSSDLKNWEVKTTILRHPDSTYHAFQYADWQFDGNDLVAVSRTGWDGSHRAHDANYFTFHRITNFRTRMSERPDFATAPGYTNGNFEAPTFTQGWTVTDPVSGDGKDVVYQTTGFGGTSSAVWLQADEYNSSSEKAEFAQNIAATGPEWRLQMSFAAANPDTDSNKPDQSSVQMYVPFTHGGIMLRVTEGRDIQVYDKDIGGYKTIFSDMIEFSADYDSDKDFSDNLQFVYQLRIDGHFNSDLPTYDLWLTSGNSDEFVNVISGLSYWYGESPQEGDGMTGIIFQPWLADGSCVYDEISVTCAPVPEPHLVVFVVSGLIAAMFCSATQRPSID